MKKELNFKKVIDNKDLVSISTYQYINNIYSKEEKDNIFVAEINPKYMDGIKLYEEYNLDNTLGVNCLICECRRNEIIKYVALLVPTGFKYNMSNVVRKHTNSRMVSVANLEYVLENTKMEYGSINPFGLPEEWKIYVDPKVFDKEIIICGSGLQKSKLKLPSKYLMKLNNIEVLDNLAKE